MTIIEMFGSFFDSFKNRVNTPLYGALAFSWAAVHWEFLYTVFFVNEQRIWDKYHLLKNEYLKQEYSNYSDRKFYILWGVTILLTGLIIWIFPKLFGIPSYKKYQEDKAKKKRIKLTIERELKNEQEQLEVQVIKTLDKKIEKVEKEQEVETATSLVWKRDYDRFKKTTLSSRFNELLESLYEYRGRIRDSATGFELDKRLFAYVHSNGLVTYDKTSEMIELTDKGKFFIKSYSEERSTPRGSQKRK